MVQRLIRTATTLLAFPAALSLHQGGFAEEVSTYFEDFETLDPGTQPEGFFAIEGEFSVAEEGGKLLRLPGSPLGSMGAVFGPTIESAVEVRAKVKATRKGRRYPAFGIGANGLGGFRLMVNPAKRNLELLLNEESLVQEPYRWNGSEGWTHLRLVVTEGPDDSSQARAKVWLEDEEEPEAWMIEVSSPEAFYASKSSIWGLPYSGEPIAFDDLFVGPFDAEE